MQEFGISVESLCAGIINEITCQMSHDKKRENEAGHAHEGFFCNAGDRAGRCSSDVAHAAAVLQSPCTGSIERTVSYACNGRGRSSLDVYRFGKHGFCIEFVAAKGDESWQEFYVNEKDNQAKAEK
jgi:hypothetical protein